MVEAWAMLGLPLDLTSLWTRMKSCIGFVTVEISPSSDETAFNDMVEHLRHAAIDMHVACHTTEIAAVPQAQDIADRMTPQRFDIADEDDDEVSTIALRGDRALQDVAADLLAPDQNTTEFISCQQQELKIFNDMVDRLMHAAAEMNVASADFLARQQNTTVSLFVRQQPEVQPFNDVIENPSIAAVEMHAACRIADMMVPTRPVFQNDDEDEVPTVPLRVDQPLQDVAADLLAPEKKITEFISCQQQELKARDDILSRRKAKYPPPRRNLSNRYPSSSRSGPANNIIPYPNTAMLAECQKVFCAGRPGRHCHRIASWSFGTSGPVFCQACVQSR